MPFTMLELRTAARSLARTPVVALSAILCLALGIGATTAISSAINRALLQSLPFREPDRLVAVFRTTPQSGPQGTWPQSVANYRDLAQRTHALSDLAAISYGTALVRLTDGAVQASQLYVTGNLFQLLGVQAAHGRAIQPADDDPAQALVAVVSDDFWRGALGSDPQIVGRTVSIDGAPTTIVGVLPRDFRVPLGPNVLSADVWMAARWSPDRLTNRGNNMLQLIGRLAPGATPAAADAALRGVFAGIVAEHPELRGENVRAAALQAEGVRNVRTPLLLLFGAVVMVLLIAATDVAALLLARGVLRRRETAVRAALGARPWDVMRPALAESLLIGAGGAVLGVVLAAAGVRTIGTLAAARLPQLAGLTLDARVVAFALGLSIVVAIGCGVVPAWRGARVDPQDALRSGRGGGAGRAQHATLRGLVVFEIALSLVLLIGAGLVLEGFAGLLKNAPGFETDHVLTLRLTVPSASYATRSAVPGFLEPALDAVRAVPGVESAGAISSVPYVDWGNNSNIRYEGQPNDDPTRQPLVEQRSVTPSYFGVTRQRLIAGRLLEPRDDERTDSPPVVVVNEALVKRDLHGANPIGARFYVSDTSFATIVGVVSNVRNMGPVEEPQPEMYWTYRQSAYGSASFPLLVRVRGDDPTAVASAIRHAVQQVDPSAAVAQVRPMREVIAKSLGQPRFYLALLGTFAAVALLLAAAGLYGVLSYVVAQRTRELGIRAALGSSTPRLVRLVARDALTIVGTGIALGIAGGFATTRLLAFMLYGVSPLDSAAWALAVAVLVGAGLVATLLPARRATRADPLTAMRVD